jgi:NAD+ diphosphatase
VAPAEAPDGERYFLGVDAAGTARFAVSADALPDRPDTREGDLRALGTLLGDADAGMLVHAVALENWHRTHRFCARCGHATEVVLAGHVRKCPACAAEHFPRTDPAVIMLVVDDQDRCLLGRHAAWPEGRFSTLAGFVEPGESLEQAVAREVLEEAGVTVDDAEYLGSQPWPFPSSLMLGFHAHASDARVRVDGEELAEARWFTRAELKAAIDAGEVLPPGGISIARRLIEHWYGEPFPEERHW